MSEFNLVLANHSGFGSVRICECNSVHVSLGPVILNFEPVAFAQAVTLMQEAMAKLNELSTADGQVAACLNPRPAIPMAN